MTSISILAKEDSQLFLEWCPSSFPRTLSANAIPPPTHQPSSLFSSTPFSWIRYPGQGPCPRHTVGVCRVGTQTWIVHLQVQCSITCLCLYKTGRNWWLMKLVYLLWNIELNSHRYLNGFFFPLKRNYLYSFFCLTHWSLASYDARGLTIQFLRKAINLSNFSFCKQKHVNCRRNKSTRC